MTVGPLTVSSAPIKMAICCEKPPMAYANQAVSSQVMSRPTDTSRNTTPRVSLISRKSRLSPPSNKMMPTASETIAKNISSFSPGWLEVSLPSTTPNSNNKTIAGRRKRQATHWAAMPRARTLAK